MNALDPNKLSKSLRDDMVGIPKLGSRYAENKSAVAVEGVVADAGEVSNELASDSAAVEGDAPGCERAAPVLYALAGLRPDTEPWPDDPDPAPGEMP